MNFHDKYVQAQTDACIGLEGPYGEKATSIVFHRNGIAGCGFYLITFKMRIVGRKSILAVGWIHTGEDSFSGHFGVSTPEHPERCWRGDHYADWFQRIATRFQELCRER